MTISSLYAFYFFKWSYSFRITVENVIFVSQGFMEISNFMFQHYEKVIY